MLTATLALGACASVPRQPYTAAEAQAAEVAGIPNARAFADASVATLTAMMAAPGARARPFAYLALSGGGGDGAYGAGVLKGWSEAGTRPEFSLVSGVSTGALTAPFAFLGPAYDPVLEEIYTSGVASTLVKDPNLVNVVFGSGLFGDGRLRDLVGRYVTPDLLAAVAAEHAKGRRLLVVTTNLDSKRAMIWNMGVIAASGAPNAAALFRDVLTASASVPAVFPAQLLDVEAAGHGFQELHVDGSVVTPVFTVPQAVIANGRGHVSAPTKADIYVLMNGRIEPDFELVPDDTLSIVKETVATGSQARSRASLAATYAFARANRIGFHLTYIDGAAPRTTAAKGFDTAYMRSLHRIGYEKARSGTAWQDTVPVAPIVASTLASR
ncbi:patatin-like phospholipase family protein [Methylobacterium brachiatum]|nr:patatin-like phospholipase family protein [Methylobacterium brachiatum]MCB4805903.1 patatin-like phospholipase family protein [Methylobacterium brachiatum]